MSKPKKDRKTCTHPKIAGSVVGVFPAPDMEDPETKEIVFKCGACGQTGCVLVAPSDVNWNDD